MSNIKWHKTSEKKPPYDIEVLGWIGCEYCRKKINHCHNAAAFAWKNNDFYPVIFKDHTFTRFKEDGKGGFICRAEDPLEKIMRDNWQPGPEPSYWAYIDPPDFEE